MLQRYTQGLLYGISIFHWTTKNVHAKLKHALHCNQYLGLLAIATSVGTHVKTAVGGLSDGAITSIVVAENMLNITVCLRLMIMIIH